MKNLIKIKYSLQIINELAEKIIAEQEISLLEIDVLKEKLIEFYSDILYFEKNTDQYKQIMQSGGFMSNVSENSDSFENYSKEETTLDEKSTNDEKPKEEVLDNQTSNDLGNADIEKESSDNDLEETESDSHIITSVEEMEVLSSGANVNNLENVSKSDIIDNNIEIEEDVESYKIFTEDSYENIDGDISDMGKKDTTVAEKLTIVSSTLHENLAAMEQNTNNKSETVADKIRLEKITDIKSAIGINDKFYFINRLFDGDVKFYNETVDKFNNFNSINDAKILLQLLINKYNWDFNDEAYKKFEDIVEKKFEV
ncbi:MAG: hypothetical protein ACOX4D_03330 [Bacteroidales bacterium]|jgi:hypothetical protein